MQYKKSWYEVSLSFGIYDQETYTMHIMALHLHSEALVHAMSGSNMHTFRRGTLYSIAL